MCDVHGKDPCNRVNFGVYFIEVVVVDINKIVKPKHKTVKLF